MGILIDMVSGDHPFWKMRDSLNVAARYYSENTGNEQAVEREVKNVYDEVSSELERLKKMYPDLM